MTGRTLLIALLIAGAAVTLLTVLPLLGLAGMMTAMMGPTVGGGWMLWLALGGLSLFVLLAIVLVRQGTRSAR